MLSPPKLLLLLIELVFVLLGLLLIWVAVTGRLFFNRRAPMWIALGAFLIYWGLRAWLKASRGARAAPGGQGTVSSVRGGSLALVGVMMLGIASLPFAWVAPLLGAAGAILVLRGAVSMVLALRAS